MVCRPIVDAHGLKGFDALRALTALTTVKALFRTDTRKREIKWKLLSALDHICFRELSERNMDGQWRGHTFGEHILHVLIKLRRAIGEGIGAQRRCGDDGDAVQYTKD